MLTKPELFIKNRGVKQLIDEQSQVSSQMLHYLKEKEKLSLIDQIDKRLSKVEPFLPDRYHQ